MTPMTKILYFEVKKLKKRIKHFEEIEHIIRGL